MTRGQIIIQHCALRLKDGWVPMYVVNGHPHWNWHRTGWDLDVAQASALEDANREAERFIGDWKIEIVEIETVNGHDAITSRDNVALLQARE